MAGRPPGRRTRARSTAKAVTRIPASAAGPATAHRRRTRVPDQERRGCLATPLRLDDLALAAGVGRRFLGELERGKPAVRFAETLRVARNRKMCG
jgi:hypothetical protein